jgi:hypothetical protein
MKAVMAGMDLHRNNVVCGLVDQEGHRLVEKRLPCELATIVQWLEPYRERLRTIAVESTYNWYWLVAGLQERDFDVVLANPARIVQCSGLKHANDTSDAFFLAELLRLNIGSWQNSGEGGADFQEEVFVIAVAVGHPFDDFDLVVDAFQQAGV